MNQICNRVAIITGGSQGIGRGVTRYLLDHINGGLSGGSNVTSSPYAAQHLSSRKWGVVVVDMDKNGIEDAREIFSQFVQEGRLVFIQGDCTLEVTAKEALGAAMETFGRVDLLVNNAGGGLKKIPLKDQTVSDFYEILHRNVGTAYVFSKIVGSHWEKKLEKEENEKNVSQSTTINTETNLTSSPISVGNCSNSHIKSSFGTFVPNAIVNISSTRALQSEHFSESYAAGKGGVVALTHALAASLSHVARVNGINLGWIDVSSRAFGPNREEYIKSEEDISQHYCNKVGEAYDVAHATLFLYENAFMSGQCITLDGGMTKKMIYEE